MKLALKIAAVALGVVVLVGAVGFAWAVRSSNGLLSRTFEIHTIDAPVPTPLSADERAGMTDEEAGAVASAQAVERGRHLIESRYVCTECHGKNLAGGVMIDDPAIGTLLGPNLTGGEGSRTTGFAFADWDRIVRHGVRSDGSAAVMPSEDFQRMSDQELSDIVAYVRSVDPVDNTVPERHLGPLGTVLLATGQFRLSVDVIPSHDAPHAAAPPVEEVSTEFGQHLAGVCAGCHSPDLAGGPIPGGDPSWPPARNLTPHPDALGPWSFDDFKRAMHDGVRPDGTELRAPMSMMLPYARAMTDVEIEALWTYLRSLPAVAPRG